MNGKKYHSNIMLLFYTLKVYTIILFTYIIIIYIYIILVSDDTLLK